MVDQLLGGLFGGQPDEDPPRRRQRANDFIQRYEQGPPWSGMNDDEVLHNYQTMAGQLSPQEYEQAAAEAFARLSPEERRALRRRLREQRRGQVGGDDNDDPRVLAREVAQSRQQGGDDPLGGLFSIKNNRHEAQPSARSGQAPQGGGVDEMLSSPVGKAVLGGMAAFAMKQLLDRQSRG